MFRFVTGAWGFALLASSLAGCGLSTGVDALEGSAEGSALAARTCAAPHVGAGSVCRLGGSSLEYRITLPSGQEHVELFAKQNGVQNVAVSLVRAAHDNGDGTTTYSFAKSGYAATDAVEYRFYSYLPQSPGVFTPGPAERIWYRYASASTGGRADVPVAKDATVILSSYCCGPSADKNFGGSSTVDVASYHHDARALFGYALAGIPARATVTKAELVIASASEVSGNGVVKLSKVNDSAAWSEATVTWNTTPASTYFAQFAVNDRAETRFDVTSLVSASVAAGADEISFFLAPVTDNIFIDSKEKSGGKPTYLHVEWQ